MTELPRDEVGTEPLLEDELTDSPELEPAELPDTGPDTSDVTENDDDDEADQDDEEEGS